MVVVLICQEVVQSPKLIPGPNKVGTIITVESLGAVPPGDEPPEAGSEGLSGEVRSDLKVHCLGGKADKDADECFNPYWSSGVALAYREGASKVHASI